MLKPEESASPAGRVLRLEIEERISPTFEGAVFGETGPYECATGSAWCDLDPLHPLHRGIINLDLVPPDLQTTEMPESVKKMRGIK